jgi:hypothetical protein
MDALSISTLGGRWADGQTAPVQANLYGIAGGCKRYMFSARPFSVAVSAIISTDETNVPETHFSPSELETGQITCR